MTPPIVDLYGLTRPALTALIANWGLPTAHADTLWRYLYRYDVRGFDAMLELPGRLRDRLARQATTRAPAVETEAHSSDGLTRKYLLRLDDGQSVETVLMRYGGRATACLSSQAGCPLACVFCATGRMGFQRNLSAGEIVAQALHVRRELRAVGATDVGVGAAARSDSRANALRNIVLMGMGEPLLNYDAVMNALDILRDPAGLAIGAKQITLSTVGVVPGIYRLADEQRRVSLAVSLHAATQAERAELVPSARSWPLDELMGACRYYTARLDRRIFFEWTLIAGRNDSAADAQALAKLVREIPAQINLIPLNPVSGFENVAAGADRVQRFLAILAGRGIPASVRQRRGVDIAAGCGQLATAAQPRLPVAQPRLAAALL